MDRRWQLVLDCLDCETAPFGKGTLIRFRTHLIKRRLDRRLIERTVELAKETSGFGSRNLRAALDSSPLWGAAKVEDTYNLLGHALRSCSGRDSTSLWGGRVEEIAIEAGAEILSGSSLKAALDVDWDNPDERSVALIQVLEALTSVESWLHQHSQLTIPDSVKHSLQVARQVEAQDVEVDCDGSPQLRRGVAKDRRFLCGRPDNASRT